MALPASDVARPYARALYEAAAAHGVGERVSRDLVLLRDLWQGDPELTQRFLSHPLVPAAAKEAVLEQALAGTVHPFTLNLVRLLLRRGGAGLLPELAPAFFRELEEEGKAVHVVARTAQPLRAEEAASLQGRLGEALGRPVTIEEVVTPSLLAGVELSVSGRRLDTSLRGRLAELAAQLRG